MTTPPRDRAAHVPAYRIVERVVALPGVRPVRLFALLLPVWAVEITATVYEAQPYEVFDRYLSRAIGQAGLRDVPSLAAFFGVEPALVERGVRFLTDIRHIQRTGDTLTLTDLGARSVAEGQRYVEKEDRQWLYFDGFAGQPLPRTHYRQTVWLDDPELKLADGTLFHLVNGMAAFRPEAVDALARRADREEFNLPAGLTAATVSEFRRQWLPAYVVDCGPSLLVFVKALDGPDPYLSRLLAPHLADVLAAEQPADAAPVWREWLDGAGFLDVTPRRMPNGCLRAVLPTSAFGSRFGWPKLGSFEVRRHTFLQLWCTDPDVRRRAVLERAGAMVRSGAVRDTRTLTDRLAELATLLEITAPDVQDLLAYARQQEDDDLVAVLDLM